MWRTKSGRKKWLANRLTAEELAAASDFLLSEHKLRRNRRLAFGPLAKAGFESGNMDARHAQWAWDSVKAHPDSWENLLTLGRILTAQGQEELAQKMIQERLENAGDASKNEEKRKLKKAIRK